MTRRFTPTSIQVDLEVCIGKAGHRVGDLSPHKTGSREYDLRVRGRLARTSRRDWPQSQCKARLAISHNIKSRIAGTSRIALK